MNWTKRLLFILAMLGMRHALALPANGTFKELGESPASDAIVTTPAEAKAEQKAMAEHQSLSNYGKLDPAEEIAILQRKFLPKRHRFELSAAYGTLVDNSFYDTKTYYGRLAYNFWETLGVEALYFRVDTKLSNNTDNLYKNGGVVTTLSSIPSDYEGLDVKWSPIYGKLAFWNKNIVPVEQFFLAGLGRTEMAGLSPASTVHIGTGFSFVIYKWLAVRAGLDYFVYSTSDGNHFTDTHLNLGVSGFFPGAEYR